MIRKTCVIAAIALYREVMSRSFIKMNGLGNEDFVTGYAYETTPNKPIIAGATKEPDETNANEATASAQPDFTHASLGLLAMGAPGPSIWRREE